MLRWIVLAVVVVVLVAGATFMSLNAHNHRADGPPRCRRRQRAHRPSVEIPEPLIHEFGTMPQLSIGNACLGIQKRRRRRSRALVREFNLLVHGRQAQDGRRRGEEEARGQTERVDQIDLEWQTKMFHDDYSKGATIGTNDPSRPSVSINVHGKVHPPVIIVPDEMITFESVSNEETHVPRDRRILGGSARDKDHEGDDFTARVSSSPSPNP